MGNKELEETKTPRKRWKFPLGFAAVLTAVILFRLFVAELCVVPSESMQPTLEPGDYVMYEKFTYGGQLPRRWADVPVLNTFTWVDSWRQCDSLRHWPYRRVWGIRQPRVGDVVVFRSVVDDLDMLLVKRINQIIECGTTVGIDSANYNVVALMAKRDGHPLAPHATAYTPQQNFYFMRGDNADSSSDSRYWGYVPENRIVGRMGLVLWSWDSTQKGWRKMRWGRILKVIR